MPRKKTPKERLDSWRSKVTKTRKAYLRASDGYDRAYDAYQKSRQSRRRK